jgi:superfamily II RNA helicase
MDNERAAPAATLPGAAIEQIEQQIADLQAELSMIASQLANPDRRDRDNGERLEYREYGAWRSRALYARGKKEQQLRALKQQRKALLRDGQRQVHDGSNPLATHLAQLCRVLARRARDGDLDQDEQDTLDAARATLVRLYGDNALGGSAL